jgi:hypothetical protein
MGSFSLLRGGHFYFLIYAPLYLDELCYEVPAKRQADWIFQIFYKKTESPARGVRGES